MIIADKFAFFGKVHEFLVLRGEGVLDVAGIAGTLFLQGHLFVEFLAGDLQAVFLGDFLGQLERKAVRIIQLEDDFSGKHAVFCSGDFLVEQALADLERLFERFLFVFDELFVHFGVFAQIRIEVFHDFVDGRYELVKERLVNPEPQAVAGCPAQHAAKHIAAAAVGEVGAVAESEDDRADVVGDDAVGHLVFPFVRIPGVFSGFMDDGQEQVGVEVGFSVLDEGDQTLEPHAGIDVFLRKFLVVLAVDLGIAVVLREDDVPYFDIAVVFHFFEEEAFAQSLRIVFFAAVEEDLGIRSARPFSDFPEVVVGFQNVGRVHMAHFGPDAVGVLVVGINGNVQFFLVDPHPVRACQKFPGERDGFFLEVIADREVAEHFEKCMVTGGPSYIFNVVGADAFLGIGDAVAARFFRTVEIFFQCCHAGIDPQQCRIVVRDQACSRFDHMPLLRKIIQEHLPNLISCQLFHSDLLFCKKNNVPAQCQER